MNSSVGILRSSQYMYFRGLQIQNKQAPRIPNLFSNCIKMLSLNKKKNVNVSIMLSIVTFPIHFISLIRLEYLWHFQPVTFAAPGGVGAQVPRQGLATFLSTGLSRNNSNSFQRQRLPASLHQPLCHVHSQPLRWHRPAWYCYNCWQPARWEPR